MRTITRFFGSDGAEQVPCDASAAVRETFFDDGRLLKREVIKANRTTLANAQATAAIFAEMELANLGTTEGAIKGWETRRYGGQPAQTAGTEWREKNVAVVPDVAGKLAGDVDAQGGFTYYPAHGTSPTTGFAVSSAKEHEKIIKYGQWAKDKVGLIKAYWESKKEVLATDLKAHIGAWYDKDSKRVFLDIVHVYPDKQAALDQGRRLGEKAIFDLENKKDIRLNE